MQDGKKKKGGQAHDYDSGKLPFLGREGNKI